MSTTERVMGEDIVTVRDFLTEEIDNREAAGDSEYLEVSRRALAAFERIVADRRALSQALHARSELVSAFEAGRADLQNEKVAWLVRFIVSHAVTEELSTHVAVSFEENDAAMILHAAEALLPSAPDAEIARAQTQGEG